MNNMEQIVQFLQVMQALNTATPQPQQKAQPEGQRFTVIRTVNAFKSGSKGIHKDKWMISLGDVTVEWRGLIPKEAFVKHDNCLKTRTKWEVTIGVSRSGKMFGIAAKDTGEAFTKDDLDDVGAEEGLDDVAETAVEEKDDSPL